MSERSRAAHRARNVLKPCSVETCPNRRLHTSRWCHSHAKKARFYGSPLGRPLKASEMAPYQRDFGEFLERQRDMPQVRAAVQFMDDLLSLGRIGNGPAQFQLHRLRTQGVTGEEALRRIAAVWLLSRDRPKLLPDDRQLTIALGAQLFKLRPVEARTVFDRNGKQNRRYLPPPAIARREVGELIRGRLGLFLIRVEEAMNAEHQKIRETAHTLAQPFPSIPLQGNLKQ